MQQGVQNSNVSTIKDTEVQDLVAHKDVTRILY